MPKFKSKHHQVSSTDAKVEIIDMSNYLDKEISSIVSQLSTPLLNKYPLFGTNIKPVKQTFFSKIFPKKPKSIDINEFFKSQPRAKSIVVFSQEEFKKEFMKIHNKTEAFFTKNDNSFLKAGLCAGFLYTWYECLLQGNNLLDIIKNGLPESLMNKIIYRQEHFGGSPCLQNKTEDKESKKADKSVPTKEVDMPPSVMNHFDFTKACEKLISSDYEIHLQEHLEKLEKSGTMKHGLHTISAFPNEGNGHVCGWTACEDGYLLFDANRGELYFDSFQTLKNYLKNHLLNMFNGNKNLSVTLEDFYLAGECEQLKNFRP